MTQGGDTGDRRRAAETPIAKARKRRRALRQVQQDS
jgi:hypothetical protein